MPKFRREGRKMEGLKEKTSRQGEGIFYLSWVECGLVYRTSQPAQCRAPSSRVSVWFIATIFSCLGLKFVPKLGRIGDRVELKQAVLRIFWDRCWMCGPTFQKSEERETKKDWTHFLFLSFLGFFFSFLYLQNTHTQHTHTQSYR